MPDMNSSGLDWLACQHKGNASQSVTYQRDGTDYTINATIGKTDWGVDQTSNVNAGFKTRDYLVMAADLPFLPRRDDKVIEVKNGKRYTNRVIEQPGIQAYRYANTNKTMIRIHTVFATVADA